jgi:glycosyltransferase involved in cell wall biosynthesis
MYHNYSRLQARQLLQQPFLDTHSTYLLVYAPGRRVELERSLSIQLHQKFRLLSAWETQISAAVDGVVLVSEDVGCMSTTLSYYAQALRQGADFAFSDAVFGFDGGTVCCREDTARFSCKFAVVSRALLLTCLQQAHDPNDPAELLALAAAAAQNPQHIAEPLLSYRRELQPDDVFSPNGKRAFVLSHELTMTGAPIVLVSAIPVLKKLGFEVVVFGPSDKGSLPLFVAAGASVITSKNCTKPHSLWGLALCCDFVLANTIVETETVGMLNGAPVPVLWWLHDAFAGYPGISHRIPTELHDNVHICAVGLHATAALHSVRPEFEVEQLVYGLPDYAQDTFAPYDLSYAGGKPVFVNVGSFELRKGQDIFAEAIRLLPAEKRARASFLFVGKSFNKEMMSDVLSLTEDYPDTVFYRRSLTRDEIKSLMQQCACVVCSSRDDPMPTFITEGLIFGKPFIVSEHTGTAGLTTEGVDGFVYHKDNPQELADALEYALDHLDQLQQMQPACRALYERHFSKQAFADNLERIVRQLTEQ